MINKEMIVDTILELVNDLTEKDKSEYIITMNNYFTLPEAVSVPKKINIVSDGNAIDSMPCLK